MKKIMLYTVLIVQNSFVYANNSTSHTFFTVRPQWRSDSPEKIAFFHNNLFLEKHTLFQASVFGGKSTNSSSLARYFLPFNACKLHVAEAQFDVNGRATLMPEQKNENLIAENINILTNNGDFYSIVSFEPQQNVFGIGLDFKQRLGKKWWFELSAPIQRVHNSMNMKEEIINDGGGAQIDTNTNSIAIGLDNSPVVASATEAFKQKNWHYGKIINHEAKWGLADIEAKIGLLFLNTERYRFNGYAGILIPTGNKPKANYVFEEIIGNNKHVGFMFGDNIGLSYTTKHAFNLSLELDGNCTYLFKNTQVRSFDPVDKSFGRYLSLYSSREQAALAQSEGLNNSGSSGINFFSGCVTVKPRGSVNLNTAFCVEKCGYATEFGFNIYARQAEKVHLKNRFPSELAIKELYGLGATNPTRGINTILRLDGAESSYPEEYYSLSCQDINMDSAAHPALLSNTVYGSIGYKGDTTFVNTGGSYEHNVCNTSLDRWLVWTKIGLTF